MKTVSRIATPEKVLRLILKNVMLNHLLLLEVLSDNNLYVRVTLIK